MEERTVLVWLAYLMIVSGTFTLIALLSGLRAMYGRYSVQSAVSLCLTRIPCFQLSVPAKWSWFLQELPSFAIPLFYLFRASSPEAALVLALFIIHYFNRTFIYPLQLKSSYGTPWFIWLSATVFCTWNGYLQGAWHATYASWHDFFANPFTYIGVAVFFCGMAINIHSDSILRNLRKPGETGYKIPRGGMFEYVSGANFFGEIVEWTGYALVCRSLPAFAYVMFTACNIGPRAYQHHLDYHVKFPDYPKDRKALIPFVI